MTIMTTMTTAAGTLDRDSLVRRLYENGSEIDVLGYIVFWNVRDISIVMDDLAKILEECGIDKKYAREHNYRSAFIRALKSLEDQRIIRKVEEDSSRLVYQFTSEIKVADDPDNPHYMYTPETIVEIDKDAYYAYEDFARAITKCDERAKPVIIELFNKEKVRYKSSDITRYVQNIISDSADIVSLRPQGSVYFVPATYRAAIDRVVKLMGMIQEKAQDTNPGASASLEFVPIPDVTSSREMISNAFSGEIEVNYTKMKEEVTDVLSRSAEMTERWVNFRLEKIAAIRNRIAMYSSVMPERAKEFDCLFSELSKTISTQISIKEE